MQEKYHLAVDIGASSGRHIVGWKEEGRIRMKEVYRFPNGIHKAGGHLVWDLESLHENVVAGIKEAFSQYPGIESLAVDTWGVDYVLMKGNEVIGPCFSYRDSRTEAVVPKVHEKMPFAEMYRRVGCQFMAMNSVYQLYDDLEKGRLAEATDMLMVPEYLLYRLTGVKMKEYTNATTTGMVNVTTGEFDEDIIRTLGYPAHLFPKLHQPGEVLGDLLPEIREQTGGNCKVVLCATHDTASAVEGIPMEENAPFISSGTWSLLGVKTKKPLTDALSLEANYSNEGGVGYNRYLKNIMGMWLMNRLKEELCPDASYDEIVQAARESSCDVLVNANAQEFLAPESMKEAFDEAAGHRLSSVGDYFRCAYRSLADTYKNALAELARNTKENYRKLYIVGGGAKNQFLNQLTEEASGLQVIALPIEATALGNLKIQMREDA